MFVPSISFAGFFTTPSGKIVEVPEVKKEWKLIPTLSGILIWAEQIIPHAEAGELSLKDEITLYIKQKAQEYNLKEKVFLWTANCESGYLTNPGLAIKIYGDKGKAYGLWQFWQGTFNSFKHEAKMGQLQYKDWKHQTELAAWAWANDYASHWVCWKLYYKQEADS